MRRLKRMSRLMLTMATLAAMPLEAQDTTRVDRTLQEADERFALLTECASVVPVFESEVEEEVKRGDEWESVGLTEAAVRRAVTSRLRAARVYAEVDRERPWQQLGLPRLHIDIVAFEGTGFSVSADFRKGLLDEYSGVRRRMTTWFRTTSGMDGGNATLVLGGLSQVMDIFIDEYLRVNAEAC